MSIYHEPYSACLLSIAKLLAKSLYEGHTHLWKKGRKKPYYPARNAYGIAQCNLKHLHKFGYEQFSAWKGFLVGNREKATLVSMFPFSEC